MKLENVEDIYPLSPAQAGMLFHVLSAPTSGVYFEQYHCTLHGPLNIHAFQQAWQQVVDRHAALRTAFLWEELDEPLQIVRQKVAIPWEVQDWRQDNPAQAAAPDRFETFLQNDRALGFELAQAPLMRLALIRVDKATHRFVWSFHHLLLDGWSTQHVLKQVFATYEGLCQGEEPRHRSPRAYRDYIAWLAQHDSSRAETYWQQRLQSFTTPTVLPVGRHPDRDSELLGDSEMHLFELSEAVTTSLTAFARRHGLTLNTVVQGAWAILLSRYSGEHDVVFGTTLSGRPANLEGAAEMVGMFINTLPVRVQIPSHTRDTSVVGLLTDLQSQLLELLEHQHTPLVDVQGWSDVPRSQSLFESIVVFENYPTDDGAQAQIGGVEIRDVNYIERSNYPLALLVIPDAALQFILIYDNHRFDTATVVRLSGHLCTLLESIAANSDQPVSDVALLTEPEGHQLQVEWNRTAAEIPDQCWHGFFEAQVERTPDDTALVCGNVRLTYRELNCRANQLARYLGQIGIRPGMFVGVYVERTVEMVVGLLGTLKAGAAYVPLDTAYPEERIAFMLQDAKVSALLTQKKIGGGLPGLSRLPEDVTPQVVHLDSDWDAIGRLSDANRSSSVTLQDPAYVIYTSGSTGQPKGVVVSHRNLVNSTIARTRFYTEPVETFLLLSSISFDSSVAGIYWTLCQGGTLCIPEEANYRDIGYLAQCIQRHAVTHLLCIPSLYQQFLSSESPHLYSLKVAIVAGEACPIELVQRHDALLPHTALFNEYGPTEATVWCTVFDCRTEITTATVPIGRPIANATVYVLDDALRPVPVGVPGELYVGGAGITQGYLNRPETTQDRFVVNPFGEHRTGSVQPEESRLYKTGDLVRYLSDGNLEFLGRNDHQVKLHGYRIELGEIEARLTQHPDVSEAAAVVRETRHTASQQEPDTAHDPSVEDLLAQLSSLDPQDADTIVASIEALTESEVVAQLPETAKQKVGAGPIIRSTPDYEVALTLKDEEFVSPPRPSQREWLIRQLLDEFGDDLQHLDQVAKSFVPGTEATLDTFDISQSDLGEQEIMEDWQTPIMKAMAEHVTEAHGDVLEIGFGRGVSATFIQELGVRSHTIVESNGHVVDHFFKPWRGHYPESEIRLIHSRWQDAVDQLGVYDGIFFHAFPLNEEEFIKYVISSATFAAHFFPVAAEHLRPGGVFTYLTTEIDSLSRRHQRALFQHFRSITLSVEPLLIPEDTRDTWWADSMVIVKAVK